MNEQSTVQTITCPYCEQSISGDALHLMAHGIACRRQWETKNESIQNSNKNENAGNSNRNSKRVV